MKFKIIWDEDTLRNFWRCKIKEQMIGHSKNKLDELFGLTINTTDGRRDPKYEAQDILDFKVTGFFGSSQIHWFKLERCN